MAKLFQKNDIAPSQFEKHAVCNRTILASSQEVEEISMRSFGCNPNSWDRQYTPTQQAWAWYTEGNHVPYQNLKFI